MKTGYRIQDGGFRESGRAAFAAVVVVALTITLGIMAAQTVRRDIIVDGNGTVVAPQGFWATNAAGITNAIHSVATNDSRLALAETAVQPGASYTNISGLAAVAHTGNYSDLGGKPTLGTAASSNSTDFAPSSRMIAGVDLSANRTLADFGAASVRQIKTGNFTAAINGCYTINGNVTITDPSGTSGQIYSVLVGAGSASIGGATYLPSRMEIVRYYSGNWTTLSPQLSDPLALGSNLTVNGNTRLGDALGDTLNVSDGALAVSATGQVTAAYQTASANTPLASTGVITPDALIFETASLGVLRPGTTWQAASSTAISKSVTAAIVAGVVTTTANHTLVVGDAVTFTSLMNPANMANATTYWVASVPTTTTFTFSASLGGSAISSASADAGSATVATAAWGNWAAVTNNFWAQVIKTQVAATAPGWSRIGIYNFLMNAGESSAAKAERGFTFWLRPNMPGDTMFATDFYFGAQLTETGGPLAARGLRVTLQPSGSN
ncbi:MAG: hypothetical protein WCO94_11670, partial [Verrucomicrobiota bacterium]